MSQAQHQAILSSGEIVSSYSEEWKEECRTIQLHVYNMRGIGTMARREYLENVFRKEGDEYTKRLQSAYLKDHETRQQALKGK